MAAVHVNVEWAPGFRCDASKCFKCFQSKSKGRWLYTRINNNSQSNILLCQNWASLVNKGEDMFHKLNTLNSSKKRR